MNDDRARLGLGKKNRGHKGGKGYSNTNAKVENQINQLKKANAQHKRTIAGLKRDADEESSNAKVSFVEVKSDKGHDAFLLDEPEFHEILGGFIEGQIIKQGI